MSDPSNGWKHISKSWWNDRTRVNANKSRYEYMHIAYTFKISELAENHLWPSVMIFDRRYRELQAQHWFRWGSDTPHLTAVNRKPRLVTPTDKANGKPRLVTPTDKANGKPRLVTPTDKANGKPRQVTPTDKANGWPTRSRNQEMRGNVKSISRSGNKHNVCGFHNSAEGCSYWGICRYENRCRTPDGDEAHPITQHSTNEQLHCRKRWKTKH